MSTELMEGAKGHFIAVIFFHCIGFDFIGGVDSDFWLVAVATCYCPDGRFLAFSWLLAAQVFQP
jgi:hypothetical protein